jgi:hypothetical protein
MTNIGPSQAQKPTFCTEGLSDGRNKAPQQLTFSLPLDEIEIEIGSSN